MTDIKFEYDEALLTSCAGSALASFVAADDKELQVPSLLQNHEDVADKSCTILHKQHALHYGNPTPKTFKKKALKDVDVYHVDSRLQRFVRRVLYIFNHNLNSDNLHQLGLNQFADAESLHSRKQTVLENLEMEGDAWESFLDWDTVDSEFVFSAVDSSGVSDIAANLTVGHGGMQHLHRGKRKRKEDEKKVQEPSAEKIKFPDRGVDPNFAVPSVDHPDMDGDLLKVKPRRHIEKELHKGLNSSDDFAAHLNWATADNPDGVPLVKEAFDQVRRLNSIWYVVQYKFSLNGNAEK
jgi:hypothetical protein